MGNFSSEPFDMMSVAACDHTFFDYGTFGFWSGYLSRGYVFLPRLYKVKMHFMVCFGLWVSFSAFARARSGVICVLRCGKSSKLAWQTGTAGSDS